MPKRTIATALTVALGLTTTVLAQAKPNAYHSPTSVAGTVYCNGIQTHRCGTYNAGVNVILQLPPAPGCISGAQCRYALVVDGVLTDDPDWMPANPVVNAQEPQLAIQTNPQDKGNEYLTVWYYPILTPGLGFGQAFVAQYVLSLL